MDVALVSRFFDARNEGCGVHSKLVYEALRDFTNVNVIKISEDDSIIPFTNEVSYTLYVYELKHMLRRKKFKNIDIFHAISPVESLYLDKNKSVINILDFIPITMPLFGKSFASSFYVHMYDKALREAVKCDNLITLNNDVKSGLIKYYGVNEDNITIIPPPISGELYPLNIKHDKYTIGTISRLDSRKRVDILIKSFLDANIENSELLIAGKGPDMQYLKNLANTDERIKFLGFIPDEEVLNFYNSLDVFVFPTSFEGYGMPMIEAMACGKPVITLDDAKIPDVIKNKTCVANKNNLANVLQNREFKCDIKKNIDFYKEHSLDNIAKKHLEVYNKAIQ